MDFIVQRAFEGAGRAWVPGDRIPAAVAAGWRNRQALISQHKIIAAPAEGDTPPAPKKPKAKKPAAQ